MSDVAGGHLDVEPFTGFEHNCFERQELRRYGMPVIGPAYFVIRWVWWRPARVAWLTYLQTWRLRRLYHIRMRGMVPGGEGADIMRIAREDSARGSPMPPLIIRLAFLLTRRFLLYFNADHALNEIDARDEDGWAELINTVNRIDIFLSSRPRLAETLHRLPRYPDVDLGTDGYVFLIDVLSILGLRSEFRTGTRRYLQRKVNIALLAMGVDIGALKVDLDRVASEAGERSLTSGRDRLEPIDVSIGLLGSDLQAAWEMGRALEILDPVRARDDDRHASGELRPEPQG